MLYDNESSELREFLLKSEFSQITFAQFGEDIMMLPFFESRGMLRDGFFVDVGAHHPFRLSNTAIYYHCFGWRGINIEANPGAVNEFDKHRDRDINVNAVVSDEASEVAFHIFNHPAASTADEEMLQRMMKNPAIEVVETVRLRPVTLASILDAHLPAGQRIRLLSVDVEGYDLRCLRSNDWSKYRPAFILVEDHSFRFDEGNAGGGTHAFLVERSYELVARCVVSNLYIDMQPLA
jgi:FkbM family methyltransferase